MLSNGNSLRIDEQSFQRLLCAAFIIQEYNDGKLADTSISHRAEGTELLNSAQGGPDLNPQGVGADDDEGLDAEVLLERLQEQFDLPALAIHSGDIGGRKAAVMGKKDHGAVLGFIPDLDAPLEQIAAIVASQLGQQHDLISVHGTAVGDRTPRHEPIIGLGPRAHNEVDAVPNHLLREIVQQVLQATAATGAAVALCLQGKLICRVTAGDSASEIGAIINTGSGFAGVCASTGTVQSCSNTMVTSRVDAEVWRRVGVRDIIVVPLAYQDQLLGVVAAVSRRPYTFGMRDLQRLQNLAEGLNTKLQVSAESAKR
jgi:GAF domain